MQGGVTQPGYFDLTSWGTVAIGGADALDYLNRMTTVDFRKFPDESAVYGAFLTGRAGVVALGMFLQDAGRFLYIVGAGEATATAEHVEKFHFQESLAVADVSGSYALFGLWNPPAAFAADGAPMAVR